MISDIFEERENYEELSEKPNLMDFSSNRLYGYLCKNRLYVPNNSFIKIGNTQAVLNFVDTNEAFEKLIETITSHSRLGRIPPSSKFHVDNISVKKSYINIHDLYKQYMLLVSFNFLSKVPEEKFFTFQSFFNRFMLTSFKEIYFLSDFLQSESVSIFSTGLALQIFDEKSGDLETAKSYIKDKFFPIFKKICLQHNFIIDRHMPWVIVYRVSEAYLEDNKSRYHEVYSKEMSFFFDTIKLSYIHYVKNILPKEEQIYANIKDFNLPRDSILKIYLRKKLDIQRVDVSDEDFLSMLQFFKYNALLNGVSDSAHKFNRLEQNYSPIYDDRQQVYLRPGNF